MKFMIPSYQRADSIKSIDMLLGYGVRPHDIVIGVQGQSERDAYCMSTKIPAECTIIDTGAHNPAGNRNALLDAADGKVVCMLDDDIKGLAARNSFIEPIDDGGLHFGAGVRVRQIGQQLFWQVLDQWGDLISSGAKAVFVNTYNNNNAIVRLSYADRFRCRVPLTMNFMMVDSARLPRLDESFDMREDLELSLRMMSDNDDTLVIDRAIRVVMTLRTMNDIEKGGGPAGGITDLIEYAGRDIERIRDKYANLRKNNDIGTYTMRIRTHSEPFPDFVNLMKESDDFVKRNGD